VLNRTTDNIIGTGIIQASGGENSAKQAEVGGLMFHPAARGFGLCSLLVKIMMVNAIRQSGRDSPDEEYLAHVIDGNGAPLHSLLQAGFRPIGPVDVHRGDIDAVIDYMIKGGDSVVHMHGFAFGREAIGKLVWSLWNFVNEERRHHSIRSSRRNSNDSRFLPSYSAHRPQYLARAGAAVVGISSNIRQRQKGFRCLLTLVASSHCGTAVSVTMSRTAVAVRGRVLRRATRVSKEKFPFLSGLRKPTQTNETIH
jgi:hypothetical protein